MQLKSVVPIQKSALRADARSLSFQDCMQSPCLCGVKSRPAASTPPLILKRTSGVGAHHGARKSCLFSAARDLPPSFRPSMPPVYRPLQATVSRTLGSAASVLQLHVSVCFCSSVLSNDSYRTTAHWKAVPAWTYWRRKSSFSVSDSFFYYGFSKETHKNGTFYQKKNTKANVIWNIYKIDRSSTWVRHWESDSISTLWT